MISDSFSGWPSVKRARCSACFHWVMHGLGACTWKVKVAREESMSILKMIVRCGRVKDAHSWQATRGHEARGRRYPQEAILNDVMLSWSI